jgi:hypothetical protein
MSHLRLTVWILESRAFSSAVVNGNHISHFQIPSQLRGNHTSHLTLCWNPHLLTPFSGGLIQKMIVAQAVKNLPAFFKNLFPCSSQPTNGSYPS